MSNAPDTTLETDEVGAAKLVVDGAGAPTLLWIRSVDLDPADSDPARYLHAAVGHC